MPEKESVLYEADRVINGEKRDDYGSVHASFEWIAQMWRVVLGTEVSSYDVAKCMICLKLCRTIDNGTQRDTIVDIAGYAGLLAQLHGFDS